MVPPINHPVWSDLVKGNAEHQFRMAAASMLFFNLRHQFAKDPSRLAELIGDAHRFFQRYESVLAADIKRLFG